MSTTSWVEIPAGSPYTVDSLPYGVFSLAGDEPRIGAAIGSYVVDLAPLAASEAPDFADVFAAPSLNPLLALGPRAWHAVRNWLRERLVDPAHRDLVEPDLLPLREVRLHQPFEVADYVVFIDDDTARHPIGAHGRAGTILGAGSVVHRPRGIRGPGTGSTEPSRQLSVRPRVGFLVGAGSSPGRPIPAERAADHIFGAVLIADWVAPDLAHHPRDQLAGSSFATSISSWVVPLPALDRHSVAPEPLDLRVQVHRNDELVTDHRAALRWTPGQLLAQLTANGTWVRSGDLLASDLPGLAEPGGTSFDDGDRARLAGAVYAGDHLLLGFGPLDVPIESS